MSNAGMDQIGVATCGLTTVTLAGNVPTIGTGRWTVVNGIGGIFALDTNEITTFTGITGNIYTLRWTISNGACVDSTDDMIVAMNAEPVNLVADVLTQPTCSVLEGSILLSGLPSGNWTINPGNISGTGATYTISGLVAGIYTFTVTAANGCTSPPSAIVKLIPAICAEDDTIAGGNGTTGTPNAGNVLTGNPTNPDTLNGRPVVKGIVNLTVTTPAVEKIPGAAVPVIDTTTGIVTVPANTPAGIYTIKYQICEKLNPINCDSATVTVVVEKAKIEANTEITMPIDGMTGGKTPSLTDNDKLNGNTVVIGTNPGEVILTGVSVPSGLTLNSDGTVTVAPNTPAGNYNVEYKICEITNPTNCDNITSVIVVGKSALNATDDDFTTTPINGFTGGTTQTILTNDIQNGIFVNISNVDLYPIGVLPKGFTLNANGTVTVAPNTVGGAYVLTYQICEKLNGSNCSTANILIFVEVPSIAIIKTAVSNDENGNGNAEAGETITYSFIVTNTGNVPLHNIVVSDPLPGIVVSGGPIDLNVNEIDKVSFSAEYAITQNDINNGSVSNQATVYGTTVSGISVEDKSDNLSNVSDTPTVLPLVGCVIKVFNAISPNGDSKNERFYIQGLECYPENTVEIYNRWGVLVFERENYNNEDRAFKGVSEGRTTVKKFEALPVGTYYYILKYKDMQSNGHQKAGYLYIN